MNPVTNRYFTAIDLAPYPSSLDVGDKKMEFVDITLLDNLIDSPLYQRKTRARELTKCLKSLTEGVALGFPLCDILTVKRNCVPLMRRDYFDLMIITGPHKMFTWTTGRMDYISQFYPSHPIPGRSSGLPCKDLLHHSSVLTLLERPNNLPATYSRECFSI
jgi:hypothetical protein